ncbi:MULTISPECIES: peptidoglycan D,D-transpeptidase FtsI family protein [Rhodopseudomonas]|uniref:Peptidoglycan glycosyltransferase n=1 Tax=Rhodopseudomonas palustris (strain DX-1) TaxID=652103 RepID=E6VLR8_RHOPX|nr:penicillin-binding protein 2 [Rhodopseudomonas palustris]NEW88669.1 penicillin-binding protein 2 [Rhodopseudomonas sp. WA056]QDL98197.1 penicillin-binding protein 2 [Rhodopseudomonas palustris]
MTEPSLPLVGHHVNWHQRLIRSLIYGRDVDRDAKARARVGLAMIAFAVVYGVIAFKLTTIAVFGDSHGARRGVSQDAVATARPDIVDRNGQILATDVKTPSLFGEPRRLIDQDEAVELLTATLPDLETQEVRERLASKKGFVWLKREITPRQQAEIKKLGIPGIGFLRENKRVYPNAAEVSHLIGLVNIDNQGIAGIEKWLDNNGLADLHRAGFASDRMQRPVELALDVRVTHALRDELLKAKEKYSAKAASGLVSNVNTGEIVAMVSLPDFDPNNPREANDPDRINRLTTGVFEMGSTFKTLTLAMALDAGKASLSTMYDARGPLHYGKFKIHDSHNMGRAISLSEVFTYSSNVGAARVALSMGVDAHKAFLKKVGQLDRLRTELPESASPLVPKRWSELNTITISFGHGVAVAPLQAVMGINAMVNGGYLIPPTFLKRTEEDAQKFAKRVVKKETSDKIRYLMRLNAEIGTAKTADQIAKGYYIGGKTGTSEKVVNGRYAKKQVLNSFTAILPADNPQYQVLVMLDEPKALPETHGFITSGWNAVPTGGKVIERIAPLLGIEPRFDLPPPDRLILAASRAGH